MPGPGAGGVRGRTTSRGDRRRDDLDALPLGRKGAECPGTDKWLLPGGFTATAAALGGEPAEADFALASPDTTDPSDDDRLKGWQDGLDQQDQQDQQDEQVDQRDDKPSDASTNEPRR